MIAAVGRLHLEGVQGRRPQNQHAAGRDVLFFIAGLASIIASGGN